MGSIHLEEVYAMNESFMLRALELARKAAFMGETPVGCVIVGNGEVIAEGYNRRETDRNALAHAELIAISDACRKLGGWRLDGCSLYVTLEPCPMCAGAVINSRVRHVIFGARDPKAGSCGSVVNLFDYCYNHTPLLTEGILADESSALLREFFARLRKKA